YHLHKGGGMCELYHTIGIFAPRSQLDSYSANVDNLWKSNGFSVMPLSCLQLPLLYSSMPMILTKKARDDLKKLKLITTKTTINAVDMMPIL
ncbi:type IV secretion system protein TraC, partial [Acinetobacter baumannii]|nr:type IV secretion system protein TraC [Acinetobacter baumannii]